MDNVAKLKLADTVFDPEKESLATYDEMVTEGRKYVEEHPSCGFAIVVYHRPKRGHMQSWVNYMLNDPLDAYAMPEFVAQRIRDLRDKGKD